MCADNGKTQMVQYHSLLSKICNYNNEGSLRIKKADYNVFDVLGVSRKEVIMCRFLADLLNPDGAHGYGILFLKTFLEEVLKIREVNDGLLTHTSVFTEYVIDDARRIDIVIHNKDKFIPIEVKICAEDQKSQCYDYYEFASLYDNNAKVVYLTCFGKEPSVFSRKQTNGNLILSLDKIKCISWSDDIFEWLSRRIKDVNGQMKEMLMQYMDVIIDITNGVSARIMNKNVELLSESVDYFQAGLQIEKVMKYAKVRLIQNVFRDVEKEMRFLTEKYNLMPEKEICYYSYEESENQRFYDCYSTYPGLNYVIKNAHFNNTDLQMWFRIEVEHNLFAGFVMYDKKADKDARYEGYQVEKIDDEMIREASKYLSKEIISPDDWWLAFCYPNGKHEVGDYEDVPNFKSMNASAIKLVDDAERKLYVKKAVKLFERELLQYLL